MGDRDAAMKELLRLIDKLHPGNPNVEICKQKLGALTDKEFGEWIDALERGEVQLGYFEPNEVLGNGVTTERNLEIAKELGYDFFPRLNITDPITGLVYKSNERYLVGLTSTRRQIQLLANKVSIPGDDQHLDQYTNQPTGPSKGSSISAPEHTMLNAQGFDKVIDEFFKVRGGDLKAYNAMKRILLRDGVVTQETLNSLRSHVKANETLQAFLLGMHIQNNVVR